MELARKQDACRARAEGTQRLIFMTELVVEGKRQPKELNTRLPKETIERILELAMAGYGQNAIVRKLKQENNNPRNKGRRNAVKKVMKFYLDL